MYQKQSLSKTSITRYFFYFFKKKSILICPEDCDYSLMRFMGPTARECMCTRIGLGLYGGLITGTGSAFIHQTTSLPLLACYWSQYSQTKRDSQCVSSQTGIVISVSLLLCCMRSNLCFIVWWQCTKAVCQPEEEGEEDEVEEKEEEQEQ